MILLGIEEAQPAHDVVSCDGDELELPILLWRHPLVHYPAFRKYRDALLCVAEVFCVCMPHGPGFGHEWRHGVAGYLICLVESDKRFAFVSVYDARTNRRRSAAKPVQGTPLPLERVHDVHLYHRLATRMLSQYIEPV